MQIILAKLKKKSKIEEKIVNLSDDETINASNVGDMMALSKLTNYEASKGIGKYSYIYRTIFRRNIFNIMCSNTCIKTTFRKCR